MCGGPPIHIQSVGALTNFNPTCFSSFQTPSPCSPVKGSMLEGKRYSTMVRSQSGIGGSLGSLGIFTGCPRILNVGSSSSSSYLSSSSSAAASSFFSSPGGGGGGGGGAGGALLGAAEIRQMLHWYLTYLNFLLT